MELLREIPLYSYLLFAIYFVAFWLEFHFGYRHQTKASKICKVFPLLFLAAVSLSVLPSMWQIYVGLLCGAISNIFMIHVQKNVYRFFGYFFAVMNQVFFIMGGMVITHSNILLSLGYLSIFISMILNIVVVLILFLAGKMKFINAVITGSYYTCICYNIAFLIYSLFLGYFNYLFVSVIGIILIAISLMIHYQVVYIKDFPFSYFWFCVSFYVGQGLLTMGYIFTSLAFA